MPAAGWEPIAIPRRPNMEPRRGERSCMGSRWAAAVALLLLTAASPTIRGQEPAREPAPASVPGADPLDKPLPDIPTLMRQVEANQRTAEAVEKNYIYKEDNQFQELDSKANVKTTKATEFEVFWANGVRIARELKRDGKDLSPDELKKQDARIDDRVKKARERREKADAEGRETDSHGRDELGVSRMLELGTFSNARRENVNGRPTILVDYVGDPKAKTHSYEEGVFRELAGTVWVDEQDKALRRLEGHFNNDFKVGGGLVMNVKKGTWFKAAFVKINDEVWLPQTIEADGHARYLLFFSLNGHFQGRTSDYRRFKATSTLLPDARPVKPEEETPQ